MVEKTSGSVMSIEESIAYHLEYNFAVPFPATHIPLLVPVCIEAIKAVNEHDLERKIHLPKGIEMEDNEGNVVDYTYAYETVALCRLDQWLNSEWF
jgi:hypothetical protein